MLTRTIHTPVWLGSGQTSWQMGFYEPRAQMIFRAVTIPPNYNLISQSDLDCHQRIVSPVFHPLQVTLNSTYALAYNSVEINLKPSVLPGIFSASVQHDYAESDIRSSCKQEYYCSCVFFAPIPKIMHSRFG